MLTDEQRTEIDRLNAVVSKLHTRYTMAGIAARQTLEEGACTDVPALLDIISTLQANLAAARAEVAEWRGLVAELVDSATIGSHHTIDGTRFFYCNACDGVHSDPTKIAHAPDCPVARAQAKLKETEG